MRFVVYTLYFLFSRGGCFERVVYLIIGEGGKVASSVEEGDEDEEGWEGLWCHVRGMRLGGTFFVRWS